MQRGIKWKDVHRNISLIYETEVTDNDYPIESRPRCCQILESMYNIRKLVQLTPKSSETMYSTPFLFWSCSHILPIQTTPWIPIQCQSMSQQEEGMIDCLLVWDNQIWISDSATTSEAWHLYFENVIGQMFYPIWSCALADLSACTDFWHATYGRSPSCCRSRYPCTR